MINLTVAIDIFLEDKMKKTTLALMLILLSATVVFAGGSKEVASVSEPEITQSIVDLKTELSVVPAAESYKKEVVIAENSSITSLDPNKNWSYQTNQVYRMVYDTLLEYNDGEYTGRAAKSWNWTDSTCTKLHVVLRDDIYFTNGEKLKAEDVAHSLQRCTYGSVATYFSSCDIVSDTELFINLKKPCVDFLFFLADTSTSIICKSACEKDADWGYVIGSGRWVVSKDEYVPGDSLVLYRNDKFWGEKPKTEKFTIRIMSDNSVALVALQNGEIDWVPSVLDSEVGIASKDNSITTCTYAGCNIEYLAFNTVNGGNLVNKNLRKAVAYAIDKDLIRCATGQATAKIADSMWGWTETGFFSDFEEKYSYNPEKAKEYVKKAVTEGAKPEFEIMVNAKTLAQVTIAQMVQELCANVGITVSIKETDAAGITANTKWGNASHQLLTYNMSLSDSNTSMWDFYLDKSSKNRAFCSDQRVQKALEKAAATEDNKQYYAEVQTINNDDVYYIPLYFRNITVAHSNGMGGVKIRMAGGHDFQLVAIAE